jgi:multidrug efflux system membrane fusion protein
MDKPSGFVGPRVFAGLVLRSRAGRTLAFHGLAVRGLALRTLALRGLAALALATSLLPGAGCDRSNAAAPPAMPPAVVTVSHPVEREVVDYDEYTGRLEAAESVDVRARVSGFIESAPFQEGSIVKEGTLLFVIDPRPFQAEVDRANAEVARAQAQVQQTSEEYARLERVRSAAATERELLNARYNKAAAEAALAAAKAALRTAQLNLDWTRVTAPIGGRIGRKLITPGNLITAGGSMGPPSTLTTVTALDPIQCYVDVEERAVLRYQRLGREHKLQADPQGHLRVSLGLIDEQGFPHDGFIDFQNNRVDPTTGTLQMRASMRNPDGFFTPGLFARMRVPGSAPYRATLVADGCVGTDQAQRFVLVVDRENNVQYRPVTVGSIFEGLRVVHGVAPDEWVVVNGLMHARPGMKVEPKPAPMPAGAEGAAPPANPATTPGTNPATNPVTHTTATAPAGTGPAAEGGRGQ